MTALLCFRVHFRLHTKQLKVPPSQKPAMKGLHPAGCQQLALQAAMSLLAVESL